jgi:beta-lactam-binding protein with PASTA domain
MGSAVETGRDERDGRNEQSLLGQFFLQRRIVLGVVIVLLSLSVLFVTSRAATSATVPDLLGERVDPQLDSLRLRLAAAGLVLNDVSIGPCPSVDVPGVSLEELPGTVIDQHPAAGEEVPVSGAVDVTICLPT